MEIDTRSDVPSYQQLAAQLRAAIEAGEFGEGPIPSINWLVQDTGLAVGTVRAAIRLLTGEGLVHTVPGRGTYITRQNDRAPAAGD